MLFGCVDPVKSSGWQCNIHSSTKVPEISVILRKSSDFLLKNFGHYAVVLSFKNCAWEMQHI